MGGIGSGRRWYFDANDTTDDYRAIDVRRWKRDGLLEPSQSFGWQWLRHGEVVASIRIRTEPDRLILSYRHRSRGSDWEDKSYPVYLNWTACHLGGKRPWFLCPVWGCGRRVAILYVGSIFACRQCYRLAYPSQREAPYDRAARRADGIREKLDWEPGILNGTGWKPKRMHWSTFHRLTAQHNALVHESLAGVAEKLDLLGESLEDELYRLYRRLHNLRGWSYESRKEVQPGSPGTSGSDGPRAAPTVRFGVGCDRFDCRENWLQGRDAAVVGPARRA